MGENEKCKSCSSAVDISSIIVRLTSKKKKKRLTSVENDVGWGELSAAQHELTCLPMCRVSLSHDGNPYSGTTVLLLAGAWSASLNKQMGYSTVCWKYRVVTTAIIFFWITNIDPSWYDHSQVPATTNNSWMELFLLFFWAALTLFMTIFHAFAVLKLLDLIHLIEQSVICLIFFTLLTL